MPLHANYGSVNPTNYLFDGMVLLTVLTSTYRCLREFHLVLFISQLIIIVPKAKQRASQILRCFHTGDPALTCKAFVD